VEKIQKVSRLFRYLFQVLLVLAPIPAALIWYQVLQMPIESAADILRLPADRILISPQTVALGYLASLIRISVWMFGLYQLIKLFKNYERGLIFTYENAKRFRTLALTIFASIVANSLDQCLTSLFLTMHNLPEKRLIAISFESSDMNTLIVGALTLLIAWVMTEASKIAEEHAATI
jgi:hypothetical protein